MKTSRFLFATLFQAATVALSADFTSTYVGGTRNWSDPASWSTPGAPGTFPNNGVSTYDAVQNGGTLTVDLGAGIAIQKLTISAGTLSAANGITFNDRFTLSAPGVGNGVINAVNGAGIINASGGMTWSAATNPSFGWEAISEISGVNTATVNGRTLATDVINVTGGMTINGASVKHLRQRAMNHGDGINPSTASWTLGRIGFSNGAVLTNKAAAAFDNEHDGLFENRGGTSFFINEGTFTKRAGTGTTNVNIVFDNKGTVNVNTGTLSLNAGGRHTGAFQIAAGSTVNLGGGTHDMSPGVSFTGGGTLLASAGTMNGAGAFTVDRPTTWNSGFTISGTSAATDQVTFNNTLAISGTSGEHNLTTRTLNTAGATTWSTNNLFFNNSGIINNSGSWVMTGNSQFLRLSAGTFNNLNGGSFTKSAGSFTQVEQPFNNQAGASVSVTGGELRLHGGGAHAGSFSVGVGTLLQLVGSHSLNAGVTFTGAGITRISGGTTTANTAVTFPSTLSLELSGGTLNGAGVITVNGPATWSAGLLIGGSGTSESITFNNTLTISGAGVTHTHNKRTMATTATTNWTASNNFLDNFGIINNSGAWNATNSSQFLRGSGGVFNNLANGVFTKSAGNFSQFEQPFTNAGTVNASFGSLNFTQGYTQTAGELVLNGGSVSRGGNTNVFTVQGGRIRGGGTLTGAVSATGGSVTLEPGIDATTGVLVITGDLTLTSGSKLGLDIGGTTPGTGHDQITEAGGTALNLAGATLKLGLLGAYLPGGADTFVILDSNATVAGSFGNVPNGGRIITLDGRGSFKVNYGSGSTFADKTQVILSDFLRSTLADIVLSSVEIVENEAVGAVVGTFSVTDETPGVTHTFTLVAGTGDSENGRFEIVGTELRTREVFDFENQAAHGIRVRVTSSIGEVVERNFAIQVVDVPNPANLALTAGSIAENLPAGTVVGQLSATDQTPGGGLTYSLVTGTGGANNERFAIAGDELRTAQVFDFETMPAPQGIRVRVTDDTGEFSEGVFVVTVLDQGPVTLSLSPASVVEGLPVGTAVGTLSAVVVPNGTEVASFTKVSGTGSTDNALFTVDGTTLRTAAVLNFETAAMRSIRLRATDAKGETKEQALVIAITDENDAPTISNIANLIVQAGVVPPVVSFTVNDDDTGAAGLVVTATSSNQALLPDAGLVTGGTGGNRTLTLAPASAVTGSATITVTVSDGMLTASDTFVFTVNDQPVTSDLKFNSQPLNPALTISASGNVTVAATDNQGVTKVDFFFSQGGGARIRFATDTNAADGFSGRLAVAQLPDGEYEITATANDAAGGSGSITGTVNLALATPASPVVMAPNDGLRTEQSSLTISGTADPESRVRVMRGGETLAGPTPPAANGGFSFSISILDGVNNLAVLAGNRAGDSPAVQRRIEHIREFPQLSVATAASVMGEDEVKLFTVAVSPVQAEPVTVLLSTNLASRLAVPASVTIPANQAQVSFNISGVQNELLDAPMMARVSASGSFLRSGFVDVQVLDDDWPVLTLALDAPWVRENDGAQATFLKVSRDQARGFAQTVFLSSSVPSAALLPSSVEIPANQASVRVPVTAVNDSALDGAQTTEFRAWVVESRTQGIVSESAPVSLEVQDDEGPTLELTVAPSVLHEGGSFVDGGVVRLPVARAGDTAVSLAASPSGLVTLPVSVTVPAGQLSAAFSLSVPATVANEGPRPVRLTCSSSGVTSGVRGVTVTDVPMPDLVSTLVQVPSSGESNTSLTVVFRIENRGTVPVTGPQAHRLFLSRDRALGDDLLVAQVVTSERLPAGGFIERTESVRLPQEEGGFFVLAQADAEEEATEASEINNLAVSTQPISVVAGYAASASVSGTMFPAGAVVPISGQASRAGGEPVSRLPVKLRITVGGIHRDVQVTTAMDGSFAHSFTPLPGECGSYTVTAAHPAASFGPAQDSFSIVAIKPVNVPEVSFDDGGSATATVLLTNPAGFALHNLTASLVTAVPGVTVALSLPEGAVLDGNSPVPLSIQAVGQAGISGVRTITIDVTSTEGVKLRLNVNVTIHALRPHLAINPGRVSQSVLRGGQKTAVIDLENTGRAATGDLQVLLPDLPMLSLATPERIPSLVPGGKAQVNLLITPPSNAPLTVTNGQILLFSPETGTMSIPFDIRVTSDSRGDLTVEVTDEFTYFSAEQPLVEGARVRLRDPVTGVEVRPSQVTATTGAVSFPLLQEGYYELEVSAPRHATFLSDILVQPGPDNRQIIFITREMVSYLWTVTESEVTDRYNIKVDTTFETNVPAPVVTLTPGEVNLKSLTAPGDAMQVNLVLQNHGFIAAQHGSFRFSTHPWYVIEPLVSEIGMIQGKQTISVPTIIRRIGPVPSELASQAAEAASRDPRRAADLSDAADEARDVVVPCTLSGEFYYDYECGGVTVPKKIPIAFSNVDGDCAGGLASDPGMLPNFFSTALQPLPIGSQGGPGRPSFASVQFSLPQACDCFEFEKKFKDDLELGPVADALKEALSKALPPPLALGEVEVKLEGELEIKACCPPGVKAKGTGKAIVTVEVLVGPHLPELDPEFETPEWAEIELSVSGVVGAKITLKGEGEVTLEKECNGDPDICATLTVSGGLELGPSLEVGVEAKEKNSGKEFKGTIEAKAVITGSVFASAAYCTGKPVEAKAGASIGYQVKLGGELEHDDEKKPFGMDLSQSITAGDEQPEEDEAAAPLFADVRQAALNDGNAEVFVLPPVHYPGVGSAQVVGRAISASDEELLAMARVPTGQGGVCAQVKMQLKQDMVLTRQGFEAVLQLTNNQPAESLSNIGFVMDIRDEAGQPANDRFQLRAPDVTGFGNIDGTGVLAAKSTGSSRWILVPGDDAAPFSEKTYFVGGQISYTEQGRSLSIPVAGVSIQVRPNAALKVSYFHQRDVFADDPHTEDVTEPAEPFYLGVLVRNDGFGEARNVRLTSGQPVIVDNEKGLAVHFQQETASVNGEPARPGSTLNFGTLAPQGRSVGIFGMRGSLLGQFNSYDASFEHLDGNGDPRLSILKSVEIHEMNHLVQANRPGDDAQPDFLTNDIGDSDHVPDTLHHSTGAVEPVVLVANAGTNFTPSSFLLTIPLTASIPAGQWGYVRIPDPSNGTMQITRVRRSDGVDLIVGRNVWTTNRTMPGLGQRAIQENILHMLDFGGTGQYEITFQTPPADTLPPSSSVAVLPTQSSAFIPVTWSGLDLMSGVAEFDIFVSDNGGPFTRWRERTKLTGATFEGVLGHAYSFFSIATDWAGNRESAPATPDATTTVSIVNGAPVIMENGDLHVLEGQQLSALIQAEDPDGPLLYELMPGAPPGMILSQSGVLSWLPGEAHGGRSYPVTVRVTDRGLPQASSLQTLAVIVDEGNQTPVAVQQPPMFLTAGDSLIVGLSAIDADLPAQQLSWQLVGGPVEGLTLDAATGLLSLVTKPSLTPRIITTVAAVSDSFNPAGVALVPLNFYIAPGGGSTTTVNPVNQPPTLAAIANPTAIPKNSGPQTVQLSGISAGPGGEIQNLGITAVSSNPTLIPHPAVIYASPGSTGSLIYIPVEGGSGTAEITVTVTDDGGTEKGGVNSFQRTFVVTVHDGFQTVSFAASRFTAGQNDGTVAVTVTREGSSAPASVTVTTSNGTPSAVPPFAGAVAGIDYMAQTMTVQFAADEMSREVGLQLSPRTGTAIPNKRFKVSLGGLEPGMVLGGIPVAEIRVLANDTVKPALTVTTPAASARALSALSPFLVQGMTGDVKGVDRVEVVFNGGAPVNAVLGTAPLATSVPWSLAIVPVEGITNTLSVTAYDLRGNASAVVTRSFTFVRRQTLTLKRIVPDDVLRDVAGTVSLVATPAANASSPAPATANSDPRTSQVVPGTVLKATATAKAGYVFSHWDGSPAGAEALGNVVTFAMPDADADLTAVFVKNPFLAQDGQANVFSGLLHPFHPQPFSKDSFGMITFTLTPGTGAFSGKVLISGISQAIAGTIYGNGSVLYNVGAVKTYEMKIGERRLELAYGAAGVVATLFRDVDLESSGIARRAIYSSVKPVPDSLLNDRLTTAAVSNNVGRFTGVILSKAQSPSLLPGTYPQGDGYFGATLSLNGSMTLTGVLADGTGITLSGMIVSSNECPMFAQLTSPGAASGVKGGCFGGVLRLDPFLPDSDLTAVDLRWVRPAVVQMAGSTVNARATQMYTDGWPGSITVDVVGAFYDKQMNAQSALNLSPVDPVKGNGRLFFSGAGLRNDISVTKFNILPSTVAGATTVTKIPASNSSFNLTITQSSGVFSGSFTPDWTQAASVKPSFTGILLQKGAEASGSGFFHSNRTNDMDPESGRVILDAGQP